MQLKEVFSNFKKLLFNITYLISCDFLVRQLSNCTMYSIKCNALILSLFYNLKALKLTGQLAFLDICF